MNSSKNYTQLFQTLSQTIEAFIKEVNKHKLQDFATETWSVKDVLCHISYWHSYYAQNYNSLANATKPFIFKSKGGSTRNQDGVDKLKHKSKNDLIDLIKTSQSSLYESIVIKKIPKMTYIAPREYKTEDFLVMISGHIKRHTSQVQKSKKRVRQVIY